MKIIVIGAGIAGLTCAYELQKAGCSVLVLEKEPSVGGRLSSRAKQEFQFEPGAQFISRSYATVLKYCHELGLQEQWMELTGLTHHLYREGKFHQASYNTLGEFLRYSYLSPWARTRLLLFVTTMGLKSQAIDFFDLDTGTEFDNHNAYDFALKWGGKEVADQVVDTLVSAYHFHHSREMSLSAFLGCLNHFTRFFTFHRMIPDMNALPQAFANRVEVRAGHPVTAVATTKKGITVQTESDHFTCDRVVFATPGHVTHRLFTTPSFVQKQFLETVQYAATITVCYRIPARSLEEVSLVVVPESESKTICSYLLPLKCQGNDHQSKETSLTLFLREGFARELMHRHDEEIFERAKRELIAVCPPLKRQGPIQPYDLQRWPHAMPKFFPGYIRLVKTFWNAGQGDNHAYFCGDFLNAPWVEGSVRCGQRTAALVEHQLATN